LFNKCRTGNAFTSHFLCKTGKKAIKASKMVICELIAQIARITSDFKMDGIKLETWLQDFTVMFRKPSKTASNNDGVLN